MASLEFTIHENEKEKKKKKFESNEMQLKLNGPVSHRFAMFDL